MRVWACRYVLKGHATTWAVRGKSVGLHTLSVRACEGHELVQRLWASLNVTANPGTESHGGTVVDGCREPEGDLKMSDRVSDSDARHCSACA